MSLVPEGPLVLAGAGRMGGALLTRWLDHGLDPRAVFVQEPALALDVAQRLSQAGVRAEAALSDIGKTAAVIVLAVKPQALDGTLPAVARFAGAGTLVLSIAAGRTIASIEPFFPPGTAIVRAMPNTPASIGYGMTVCCPNRHADHARGLADRLMTVVGDVAWVADETLMDTVTAVSGSGPAYVFLLTECLAEAGQAAGLDKALARQLARKTVEGAAALMRQSDKSAKDLREDVTSPGGTTAAAVAVLTEAGALRTLMLDAVIAARDRGRELSK